MSSRKTKEAVNYILVDNQENALYEEVEELLQNGWKLYGYPFSHNGCIVQCLIRKKQDPKKTAK